MANEVETPDTAAAPQAYQALYRRYRPQRFGDVVGQEHVTRALANSVRDGRVAHAYLFSGPRGTGKTSTARILAMALNCADPQGGEPDGTCASCKAVRAGSSMDVFELDAASNRKLDEMRDLLSRVALGTPGRWKVYIIDEVHQLTSDASSALLKTLEEPPGHVVFVLATTDPQKVLPTILSRTQHFQFHLLDGEVLTDLLNGINDHAELGLSPSAIKLAVQKARGSARDAESALEQLAASGEDYDGASYLPELVAALADRDVGAVLQAVAGAVSTGSEPRRLGSDLVGHLRNMFLAGQAPSLVLLPAPETARLAEDAKKMGLASLVRCMEVVGQALVDMRDSVDARVTLEMALVRLASPAADTSLDAVLQRVERLERAAGDPASLASGAVRAPRAGAPSTPGGTAGTPSHHAAGTRPGDAGTRPGDAAGSRAGGQLEVPLGAAAAPAAAAHGLPATPGTSGATSGPAQARVALGALLKGTLGSPATTPRQAEPATGIGPRPDEPRPGQPAGATNPARSGPDLGGATSPARSGPDLGGAGAGQTAPRQGLPTRDELTKAWGDSVLPTLPRPAQVYMANGRFADVAGGAAVFALPDTGLFDRSKDFVADAEAALASHFGRPVPLRLVVDKDYKSTAAESARDEGQDQVYDLDDLDDLRPAPGTPVVPVEQRLMEAFPGAVLDD